MIDSSDLIVREPRYPLYAPVMTRPPLRDAWTVNVSKSGIGLAFSRGGAAPLEEGSAIEIEFALPATARTIRAAGVVAWMYEASDDPSVGGALGIRFTELTGTARVDLLRYLEDHRPHVAICMATAVQAAVLEEAAGEVANLHFASSMLEIAEVLLRGDIAAAIVFGSDPEEGGMLLETLADRFAGLTPQTAAALLDTQPRMIYCGPVEARRAIQWLNSGRTFRVLGWPVDPLELERAVAAATSAFGVQTEQRRATLALQRALARNRVSQLQDTNDLPAAIVLESPAMREVVTQARAAAPHKVSVLLQGETGTGKEVLAGLVHQLSDRVDAPFVVQDCGALTETLLESELFGHVKGAFTGAVANHPGLFVLADGGTIFLDEIENTSPNMQSKLLRAIEAGEVRPVGGATVRHVDVRVIAASNADLEAAAGTGRFRADLFYRLNTFPIHVPPLRQRREDIMPLALHILARTNATFDKRIPGFTDEAERRLHAQTWPGNIRQLRNVVERAVLLCSPGQPIPAELLPPLPPEALVDPSPGALRAQLARVEAHLIGEALARHGNVVRRAALELGMNPVTLARRIKRLGMEVSAEA